MHRSVLTVGRTVGADINDDTVYGITTTEVFKGEPDQEYAEGMTFDITTGGNTALCGIYMEIGEEYLIDLYRNSYDDDNLHSMGTCGMLQLWSSVDDEDLASLEDGCEDDDPCDGNCRRFQVRARRA